MVEEGPEEQEENDVGQEYAGHFVEEEVKVVGEEPQSLLISSQNESIRIVLFVVNAIV